MLKRSTKPTPAPNLPKVIAFDVFGTVFDIDDVSRQSVQQYVDQVRSEQWRPLQLPRAFHSLPAHKDAASGIRRLRKEFTVVTLSNCPAGLLMKLSRDAGITWDAIVPIQMAKVYKPHLDAYRVVTSLLGVPFREVMMVTANRTFGDLEAAEKLGMIPMLIRDPQGEYPSITALAKGLGC